MEKTYDEYLLSQTYSVYFAFGEAFWSHSDAVAFAFRRLSLQGILVEILCLAVPECACQNCGEILFDWQKSVGECAGTSGSDSCWFSLSGGLVCERCAKHEAELEVHAEEIVGSHLIENETLYELL